MRIEQRYGPFFAPRAELPDTGQGRIQPLTPMSAPEKIGHVGHTEIDFRTGFLAIF
jgi:hypothetical protein